MAEDLVKSGMGALAVPDHLKDVKGHEGMELVRKQDLILPRLGVSQGNNPQMKRANPLYIEGLKDGQFFNPVFNLVYGEKLQFISLSFAPSRILFKDMEEGGGILCRSFNGIDGGTVSPTCDACPKSKWGAKGESPECTEFMNFPFIILGPNHLVVSSWKSTALKPARTWMTRMDALVQQHNKPMYAFVSEVELKPEKRDGNDFFIPVFTVKRWATDEEFKFAEAQYKALSGKSVGKMVVDQEEKREADEADEEHPF